MHSTLSFNRSANCNCNCVKLKSRRPYCNAIVQTQSPPLTSTLKDHVNCVKQVTYADDLTSGQVKFAYWSCVGTCLLKSGQKLNTIQNYRYLGETTICGKLSLPRNVQLIINQNTSQRSETPMCQDWEFWLPQRIHQQKSTGMGRRTTHPQAAYIAFVVGYNQKFNYVFWMMKDLNKFSSGVIKSRIVPTTCNRRSYNDMELRILALPIKYRGSSIINQYQQVSLAPIENFAILR